MKEELSLKIKKYAKELGFELTGITSTERVNDYSFYQSWLNQGFAGTMEYLKRNTEKRENPELLFPGTRSIVCVGLNYYTGFQAEDFRVAGYALGEDYHFFMKDKLNELLEKLKKEIPELDGKAYVDKTPVLERSLARRAGLGWIGKNTMLINRQIGSYFLLGELFLNIELAYDSPQKDLCGSCNRCLKACPTEALIAPRKLDANLCIAYLTIEAKEEIPEELSEKLEDNIFGCDICQDVCPWNKKFAQPADLAEIKPREWLKKTTLSDLLNWKQADFSQNLQKSAIKRTKFRGLVRNVIAMLAGKSDKNPEVLPILEKYLEHEEPVLRKQAQSTLKKFFKS